VRASRPATAPMCSRARRRSRAVGLERCDTGLLPYREDSPS
jgi:hypothetical protein